MTLADPFPEEAFLCINLYLERQDPSAAFELSCFFCNRTTAVTWQTSLNLGNGTLLGIGVCEHCREHLKPKGPPPDPDGFVHVDDFIDSHRQDPYARFVLDYFRRSAVAQIDFRPFMEEYQLYCTWKSARYRVTGASRLGDIWLTSDFSQEVGYQNRVNVAECAGWGPEP